jgi:hypothetical protein
MSPHRLSALARDTTMERGKTLPGVGHTPLSNSVGEAQPAQVRGVWGQHERVTLSSQFGMTHVLACVT